MRRMAATTFQGRRAVTIENDQVRLTLLVEGGHIAEFLDKRSGVNPLWIPHWPSIEPSQFGPAHHGTFGAGADGKLLAGIMGHNLCLDIFGAPTDAEARAGLTVHGEGSVVTYRASERHGVLSAEADFPSARLKFSRWIALDGRTARISERLKNLSQCDRPIAWTQHVTLAPPFLQPGVTEFRTSATRSRVFESAFGSSDYLAAGANFDWPIAPRSDGGTADLRVFNNAPISSAYTAHLMDPRKENAFFVAFSPQARLAFGYIWRQRDFPWLGIWEENRSRPNSPWNGQAITRGLEFGVSPFPETRRQMIERGRMFDTPTYRWVPGHSDLTAEYQIVMRDADRIPETLQT
jgi:hypothetical protein